MITRHALAWADLADKTVGVWGLGVEGSANVRRALAEGAVVHAVDRARAGTTIESLTVSADEATLGDVDVVIKSPGISRYSERVVELEAAGIPVVGGHGLWIQGLGQAADRVAVVTGTKGKSTTTAIVGHWFDRLGLDGAIGGNIGAPPYDPNPAGGANPDPAYWCIELSSYQVTDLAARPKVAAVSSLSPDHVEWHRSLSTYYEDKLSLVSLPPLAGITDPVVFAGAAGGELSAWAERLHLDLRWVEATGAAPIAEALGVRGAHNVANTALSIAIVEHLTGRTFSAAELVVAAEGFAEVAKARLGSRLTTVATLNGVEFIDDCLSTNTLPTIAALDSFADRPTALIVGGFDRGIDYDPLGQRLSAEAGKVAAPVLVLALSEPDNGATVAAVIERYGPADTVEVVMVESVEEAVGAGWTWCRRRVGPAGAAVLLSPAAPTRGHALAADGSLIPTRYPNYGAKAAAFTAAVEGVVQTVI